MPVCLGVSSLLCVMQAVGVAAAEVWSLLREGDGSCRLSRAPSAVPYAHTLAPMASRYCTLRTLTCSSPMQTCASFRTACHAF